MSEPEETYTGGEGLQCPYCLALDADAWEMGDGGEGCGETECGSCGKEFRWARHITVNYSGKPIPDKPPGSNEGG
jgi:hypothetical protein